MRDIIENYEKLANLSSILQGDLEVMRETPKELAIFSSTKLRKDSKVNLDNQ